MIIQNVLLIKPNLAVVSATFTVKKELSQYLIS